MEEERVESVYDSGYGNPCRYLQQVLNGFLRCLGLERSVGGGGGGGNKEEGGGAGGDGGGEMDDPLTTPISDDSSSIDPVDEPASTTVSQLSVMTLLHSLYNNYFFSTYYSFNTIFFCNIDVIIG